MEQLIDIVLTDKFKTVLHGKVGRDVYDYLTSASRTEDGWHGRIRIYDVCQVVRWRNENGFTGLLALGPVHNQHGDCLLSVRAPVMVIQGSNLTSADPITAEAAKCFAEWRRA